MPPLPAGAGKLRLVPLNMQSVDAAIAGPPEPQPAPAIPEPADDSPEDDTEDQATTEDQSNGT
jgi:hypothetical protein